MDRDNKIENNAKEINNLIIDKALEKDRRESYRISRLHSKKIDEKDIREFKKNHFSKEDKHYYRWMHRLSKAINKNKYSIIRNTDPLSIRMNKVRNLTGYLKFINPYYPLALIVNLRTTVCNINDYIENVTYTIGINRLKFRFSKKKVRATIDELMTPIIKGYLDYRPLSFKEERKLIDLLEDITHLPRQMCCMVLEFIID